MTIDKKIMILGAGPVGFRLAELLASTEINVLHLAEVTRDIHTDIVNSVFSIADFGTSNWLDVKSKLEVVHPALTVTIGETSLDTLTLQDFDFVFDCRSSGEIRDLIGGGSFDFGEADVFVRVQVNMQ